MLKQSVAQTNLQKLCLLLGGNASPLDVPVEEWAAIVAEAETHNVGPFLLWVIEQSHASIPGNLDQRLREAHRQAIIRFMLLQRAQQDVTRALDVAGIPHIWLKGIVLAATVYPDPALRPMVDLDVLVKPEQVEAALECLRSLGYNADQSPGLFDSARQIREGSIHHHVLRGGPSESVLLELHFAMLVPRARDFLPPEQEQWFHAQATRFIFDHDAYRSLSNEAHFLYLCAHMVLHHGLHDFALTRPFDLHLMITRCTLDWMVIVRKTIDLGWTYVAERSLQEAQAYFLTSVPSEVMDELHAHRPPDHVIRTIEALGQPGALFESVRSSIRQLNGRERIAWAWQIAAPRPSYMRSRYQVPDDGMVWPYYLRRWRHQFHEVVIWAGTQAKLRLSSKNTVSSGSKHR